MGSIVDGLERASHVVGIIYGLAGSGSGFVLGMFGRDSAELRRKLHLVAERI